MANRVYGRSYEEMVGSSGQPSSSAHKWKRIALVAILVASVAVGLAVFAVSKRGSSGSSAACKDALSAAETWRSAMQQRVEALQGQLNATQTPADLATLSGRLQGALANLPDQAEIWRKEQMLAAQCAS